MKRQSIRVEILSPVADSNAPSYHAWLSELTATGCVLECRRAPAMVGEIVDLVLPIPSADSPLELSARIEAVDRSIVGGVRTVITAEFEPVPGIEEALVVCCLEALRLEELEHLERERNTLATLLHQLDQTRACLEQADLLVH